MSEWGTLRAFWLLGIRRANAISIQLNVKNELHTQEILKSTLAWEFILQVLDNESS